MKTLKFFATAILLLSFAVVSAQTSHADKPASLKGAQFYVELGGPGGIFSANFDSRFKRGIDLGWGYRAGLGFGTVSNSRYDGYGSEIYSTSGTVSYATIPLGLNYVFGKKTSAHSFEVGFGTTILTKAVDLYNYEDNYKKGHLIGHTSFMYRKKPLDGGFTWRIGFTPIIGTAGDIYPSGAVGLGYAF